MSDRQVSTRCLSLRSPQYAVRILLTLLAVIAGFPASANSRLESLIETEIDRLFEGRLDRRLYIHVVDIAQENAPNADAKTELPFVPFAVDAEFFDQSQKSLAGPDIPVERLAFTIHLTIDEKVDQNTIKALEEALQKRFSIENNRRKVETKKAKIYSPENEIKDEKQAQIDQMLADLKRMESDLAKKESERASNQNSAGEKFQQQLKDIQERLAGTELVRMAKDFQVTAVSLIIALIVIVTIKLSSTAFKAGMSLVADGMKTSATSLSEAFTSTSASKTQSQDITSTETLSGTGPKAATGEQDKPKDSSWIQGNLDFDSYLAKIKEKIEVLSREKNFNFVRQFIDMAEDPDRLPLAAALVVSLPHEQAQQLIQDIASVHVRSIHQYLQAEGGLEAAKSLRFKALQEFYGRIAMDEFTNSPLMSVNNLTAITRMTSEDMAQAISKLSTKQARAFLACLSPSRTRSVLAAAKDPALRDSIIDALANLETVTPSDLTEFFDYIQRHPDVMEQQDKRESVIDVHQHLASVISDLELDQDEIIAKIITQNPRLKNSIYEFYLPFQAIVRVPREWVTQILESRTKSQVATILFTADSTIREYVVGSLPTIKANAVLDELKQMDEDKIYAAKNRINSKTMQKTISNYILTLVKNQTIQLTPEEEQSKAPESMSSVA